MGNTISKHSVPQISVATKSIPTLSESKTCSIKGCDKQHHAKGLCSAHYHRLERYGDPRIDKVSFVEQQKRIERLVTEVGQLKEDAHQAEQRGYRKGTEEAIANLKKEYRNGYEAGRLKGKGEQSQNHTEYNAGYNAGYQEGLAQGRNQGTINGDTWFKRSQFYESENKRLKALIGKAIGVITEEML